jgi:SOS-response transcriptional repressor LexA
MNLTTSPLTPKEKVVLEFLEMYARLNGFAPTYQEICKHFGFASFNSAQRYLKQLEENDSKFALNKLNVHRLVFALACDEPFSRVVFNGYRLS